MTRFWLHHSLYSDFKDPDPLHRRETVVSISQKDSAKYTRFFFFVNSQTHFFLKFFFSAFYPTHSLKLFAIPKQSQPILAYFNSIKTKKFQPFFFFCSPPGFGVWVYWLFFACSWAALAVVLRMSFSIKFSFSRM